MGWPKGKPRKSTSEELKLTAPPDEKKAGKPKAKQWSGTWVESETTKIDRANGGRTCVVKVLANQHPEIGELERLFDQFSEAEVATMDEGKKLVASILKKSTRNTKKPGASLLTLTLKGSGSFAGFVGRNVTVSGRQKKLPIVADEGEPR